MLERGRHAADLRRSEAKLRGLLAPRRNCLPNLPCDLMGFAFAQLEIIGDLKGQLQRGRAVVKIDGCGENPRFEIGGNRIEVVGRRQAPPGWTRPEKTVIAQNGRPYSKSGC